MSSLKLNFWLLLLERIILSSNGKHKQMYKPKVHKDQTSNSADSNNYICFQFNNKQQYNKSDQDSTLTLVTTHLKEAAQEVQINSNTTTLLIQIITKLSNVFSLGNK